MKTYRLNSVMAGVLYVLGTVFGIAAYAAVGGRPDEAFLERIVADPSGLAFAALCILLMGLSLVAMTIFLYPLVRKDSEPLAMGMVLFRGALEGSWYVLSAFLWILLGTIAGRVTDGYPGTEALTAVGNVIVRAESGLGDIGSIIFIIGAGFLYTSFYRTRLIPRWLSIWGLLASLPYLLYFVSHFFNSELGLVFLVVPLAVQEMVMGLWLIIRGFSADAVRALEH